MSDEIPQDIRETVRAWGNEKYGEVALHGWPRIMERAILAERIRAQSEERRALDAAREIVDAVAGGNRPDIMWARQVRDTIDAAIRNGDPNASLHPM